MSQRNEATDVAIVGGAGHVGLPLALTLAKSGLRVAVVDRNQQALEQIQRGEMPFTEHGGEELLAEVLAGGRLSFSTDPARIAEARVVIVTVGTPVDEFLNPEVGVIRDWADAAINWLTADQLIVLRSTVFPGTTDWLADYLEKRGVRPQVAFCPERVAQGHAIDELARLPQIVSGTTPEAEQAAAELFERIAPEIVRLSPIEAEFAKLFTNAYRYINFAIVNQFYMLAAGQGLDFNRILESSRHNYPRMAGMPRPGLTAGPCLFKDTMQLAAFSNNQFALGHAAMLVNEGLPAFLVDQAQRQCSHDGCELSERTVGILGMAFKADIDDTRASLSYKLKKILDYRAGEVLCTDPYVQDESLAPLETVLEEADVLFIATPHAQYRRLDIPAGKIVIDVWNCLPADAPVTRSS